MLENGRKAASAGQPGFQQSIGSRLSSTLQRQGQSSRPNSESPSPREQKLAVEQTKQSDGPSGIHDGKLSSHDDPQHYDHSTKSMDWKPSPQGKNSPPS